MSALTLNATRCETTRMAKTEPDGAFYGALAQHEVAPFSPERSA
jgi:hypothetical protein